MYPLIIYLVEQITNFQTDLLLFNNPQEISKLGTPDNKTHAMEKILE
jgi:hypothetical protein